jgi:cytochrome c-type biogenesis protein CcmH/NrfF
MSNQRARWSRLLGLGLILGSCAVVQPWSVRVAVAAAPGAAASSEVDPPEAQGLYRTIMSPFCPGRTLDDCPSPYAGEWRHDIRQWLREGVPTDEIRRRLLARMPDRDLTGAPSTALDAVLPISVVLGSLLLLGLLLRLLLRPTVSKADASAPSGRKLDEKELEQRLDDELQALDE